MTDYPSGIFSPREKENKAGVVYNAGNKTVGYVEDTTFLDDEVVAIENELGTNPKGTKTDVKTRLDDMEFMTPNYTRITALLFKEMMDFADGVGATISDFASTLIIWTAAAGGNYAVLTGLPNKIDYSKDMSLEIYVNRIVASTNGILRFWCDNGENDDTAKHIGFRIEGSTVYATSSDGTTNQTTDITSQVTTGTGKHRWKWVFTSGTSVKFYFDGVLVATHTTNIPSGAVGFEDIALIISIDNNGDAIINRFYADQVDFEAEN